MNLFSVLKSTLTATIALSAFLGTGCSSNESQPELVEIPLMVNYTGSGNLNLVGTPATSYKVDITGCASGYSGSNITAASINVYKLDNNCAVRLTEFVYATKTWIPTAGLGLTSGTADFKDNADASKTIKVSVKTNLSDPVNTADVVEFNFFEIKKSATVGTPNYSEAHNLSVTGIEAPNFEISTMTLASIGETGTPTYDIKFECQVNIGGGNTTCPTSTGDGQLMANMQVQVVENATANTLTYAQAEAAFTSGTAITVDATIGAKGGMKTMGITGPGPLHTRRTLFVIIRYIPGGVGTPGSYTYFQIDITAVSN
jgi:hypothetical protein